MIEDTPAQYETRIAAGAAKILRAAIDAAGAAGVAFDAVQVEDEHPYQAIIATAGSKGSDLIVMASHGATASRHSCSAVRRSRCSPIAKYLFSSIAELKR
jgi:nucleotide-binding universal stress UspA family protein